MDPKSYQRLAERTECDQDASRMRMAWGDNTPQTPDTYRIPIRLNHAVVGLVGEVGELAGAVERWIYYGKPLDKVNVGEEIGDCLWYLALACNALELDMGALMQANIAKLKARYPEKYTDAQAAEENRDRAAERLAALREYEAHHCLPEGTLSEVVEQDGHGFGHVGDSEFK